MATLFADGTIEERAFRAFIRVMGLVTNTMEPYFSEQGISGAQWGVLRSLHRAEGEGLTGLRLGDLGRRLLVRPPSVTGVVDRLEKSGLVARRSVAGDRRAREVVLTPSGRRLLKRVLRRHPAQIHRVMSGLDESELGDFRKLMEKMAAHLEANAPETTPARPRRA